MNDIDKENLRFFLESDSATLKEWMEWADAANVAYAMNLIQRGLTDLQLQALDVIDRVDHTDDADRAIIEILEKFDTK
jgi:hypothetical protein